MKILSEGLANVLVENTCPFCKKSRTVMFRGNEFRAWQNGAYIQNAMPKTSADDREFLMTGMCADCFPSEDD
jgi:hypothetical protein